MFNNSTTYLNILISLSNEVVMRRLEGRPAYWSSLVQVVNAAKQGAKQGTGSSKRRLPADLEVQAAPSGEGAGFVTSALGFWKAATRQLQNLEDKLVNQVPLFSPQCYSMHVPNTKGLYKFS